MHEGKAKLQGGYRVPKLGTVRCVYVYMQLRMQCKLMVGRKKGKRETGEKKESDALRKKARVLSVPTYRPLHLFSFFFPLFFYARPTDVQLYQ